MEVVGHEMAVDAGLVQQFRKGVVEGLQRAPAAVQEGKAAGQHVAPGRHAGQAADIVAVERHRAARQPVEVRRRDPRAAVGAEHVPVQRVEEDENGLHGMFL